MPKPKEPKSKDLKPIKVTHQHLKLFRVEVIVPFILFIFVLVLTFIFPDFAREQENIDVKAVYAVSTRNDRYIITKNTELHGNEILENDTGEKLEVNYFDIESKEGGAVMVKTNGVFMYRPPMDFVGEDSFRYFVKDRFGNNAKGMVLVEVKNEF